MLADPLLITTSSDDVGTEPEDQLPAVVQLELTLPFHVIVAADKAPATVRKAANDKSLIVDVFIYCAFGFNP